MDGNTPFLGVGARGRLSLTSRQFSYVVNLRALVGAPHPRRNVPRDHRPHWERVRNLRRSLVGAPR